MWSPAIAHVFHLQKNDMVDQNIRLGEYLAMVDGMKEQ